MRSDGRALLPVLVAVLVIGLIVGAGFGWTMARRSHRTAQLSNARNELAASISAAERKVSPAVVTLDVAGRLIHAPGQLRLNGAQPSPPRLSHSQGTGLIVDPRGYIVTNRHVVRRAARIAVHLNGDERTYYAKLVGEDAETDLAVVKITVPRPLPTAALADSARVDVGDWVVAIGSPFGLSDTVTAGIVSALHRAMDPRRQFAEFIQTDAPINPGNSGGPLVNLAGEVVGINTAIYTESDSYSGIGFALPSDIVRRVVPELIRQGHVTRASIGVYFESKLSSAVRRIYGLNSGVPITQVVPNGPAAKAGLVAGDVITSFNGVPISSAVALIHAVEFYPVGTTARIGFLHDSQPRTAPRQVIVTVADRDHLYASAPAPRKPTPAAAARPAAAQTEAEFGMALETDGKGRGVRVMAVAPDSFADHIGINAGDLILEINRRPISNRRAWDAFASHLAPGSDVAMLLRRSGRQGGSSRWLVGGIVPPPLMAAAAGQGGGGQP
ncbi:MAG: trypsin-like peptidase domain-containing protein [Terriglobales bacterium]